MSEVVTCPVCGAAHGGMYLRIEFPGVEAPAFHSSVGLMCGACAGAIANLYSLRHSGEPLTWPRTGTPMRGYRKEIIPQSIRWEVFMRDGFACVECGSQSDLTADHIHPESKGGKASRENLRTLCRSCNSKKGAHVDGQG